MVKRKKGKLLWEIYPSYLIIICICIIAGSIYSLTSLKGFFYSQVKDSLEEKTLLFVPSVKSLIKNGASGSVIDTVCVNSGARAKVRFTIIDHKGLVVGDTEEDPANLENHKNRPEIRAALSGKMGSRIRFSDTLDQDMMYVAYPVYINNNIVAAVRTSVSLEHINHELWKINKGILIGGIIAALIAAGISFFFSLKITRPIVDMKKGAKNFAEGKLDSRMYIPEMEELGDLARALNSMAEELNDKLRTESINRNELETVFLSMREGVLALDMEERVIRLNQSALDMFSMEITDIRDKKVYELVRDSELYRFIQEAVKTEKHISSDLKYGSENERILNAQSSPLKDENFKRIGTLFVIQDVTKIRHLENMRKDFVANVSHELKTPMTAIKGFVETIRESENIEQEKLDRFFSIIDKNVDRLINIINDLLDLSWIEKNEESEFIKFREENLLKVAESAVKICEPAAIEKDIRIDMDINEKISVNMNRVLFENALTNLIDNALKYSDREKEIRVFAKDTEDEVILSVKDNGIGIPSFEQQRIFERFYRVDKGRSRKMGGTGLGLSIVKHVVNIHKGRVELESTPGTGSCFTIIIPKV